jgi:hypothetical protein
MMRPFLSFTALALLAAGCTSNAVQCDEPLVICSSGVCANLDSDPEHCGFCETACSLGQSCVSGQCICPGSDAGTIRSCSLLPDAGQINGGKPGQTLCVDVSSDSLHCGECNHVCPAGQLCRCGTCQSGGGGLGPCPP